MTVIVSMLALASTSSLGCKKQPTETPDAASDDAAAPAAAEPDTPEQSCARMLERFGEDVAESESEACVEALTSGTELALCREAGVEADYVECFDSCMGSVDIDPAEYNPGDSSTSPVVNCVAGCSSTTCQ